MLGTSGSAYAAPDLNKHNSVQTEAQKLEVSTVAEKIIAPTAQPAVVASPEAKVSFEKSAVTTIASPERVAAEAAQALAVKAAEEKVIADAAAAKKAEEDAIAAKAAQASQAAAKAAAPTAGPVAAGNGTAAYTGAPATAAASNGSIGQKILAAARAQLGVNQDCTMLVTNSLKAVGINFHDWPAGYLSLGTVVSAADAQPGDLLYYVNGSGPGSPAHIAVYAGGGRAIHGGWNGSGTVEFSANVGSGPVYIRVAG